MRPGPALAILLALGLVACGPEKYVDPLKPPEKAEKKKPETPDGETAANGTAANGTAKPAAAAAQAPHVYMALQPDDSGTVSVIFAIDSGRNETPGDDPAIRLTPEDGKCNPQELRRFDFPPESAKRPVFGAEEAQAGVTAKDLPRFMAMAVTAEMLRRGLVTDVEASKPQNVCTRKLWERMLVNQAQRRAG